MSTEPRPHLFEEELPADAPPNDRELIPVAFDDDPWDVFLADGDTDPLPEWGDFWVEDS